MKRKNLIQMHLGATALATITITTFLLLSLWAEFSGSPNFIKTVKQGILYALPLLVFAMPMLAITGHKLAGNSKNLKMAAKKRRMKFVMINGITLTCLAIFLYYQSHFKTIDTVFLTAQIAEFVFGIANLTLIGLNIRDGLSLSGKLTANRR